MARIRTFIVENTWVCSSCRSKNLGRAMSCTNCGSPKEKHEAYDTSRNLTAPAVSNTTMLADARAGQNWSCAYCGQDNRATLTSCEQCGAARGAPPRVPFGAVPAFGAPRGAFPPPEVPLGVTEMPGGVVAWLKSRRAIALYVVVTLLAGLLWFLWPREVSAEVDHLSWKYTRFLEQRETRHGSGWGHPGDGFNVSCSRRFKGTEQCNPHDCNCHQVTQTCSRSCDCHEVCHTTCSDNGNGYSTCTESCDNVCSTCQEPCGTRTECDTCYDSCDVYDDWCEYDYYAWPEIDQEVTSGTTQEVTWGKRLTANESATPPQRIRQTEEYEVVFVDREDRFSFVPKDLASFRQFEQGSRWRIKVYRTGTVEPLHAESP